MRNPVNFPVNRYPRSIRGGSWDDDAKDTRSAARRPSRSVWKATDPGPRKSAWFYSNASVVGFRIVRPLKIPSAEEMHRIWNLGMTGEDK